MSETNEKKFPRLTEKDREHFSKPVEAAKWLLGKVICRELPDGEIVRLYITETEAYDYKDEACYGYDPQVGYAHIGKKTVANAPLFEQACTSCVFGGMLLISCGEIGNPDNVLIRSAGNEQIYFNGPYKIYKGMQLNKNLSNHDLLKSDYLWLAYPAEENPCCQTTRVGLSKSADKQSREAKHRFIIL